MSLTSLKISEDFNFGQKKHPKFLSVRNINSTVLLFLGIQQDTFKIAIKLQLRFFITDNEATAGTCALNREWELLISQQV